MTNHILSLLISVENYQLLADTIEYGNFNSGKRELPIVVTFDNHLEHIQSHKQLLSNPQNHSKVKRILDHINEHVKFLDPQYQRKIQWEQEIEEICAEV